MNGYFKLEIFTLTVFVPEQVDDLDQDVVDTVLGDICDTLTSLDLGLPEGWKVEVKH